MTTRRTRARALPAVALAAALVLAPTAALAAETDPAADGTSVPEVPAASGTTAPVDETTGVGTPVEPSEPGTATVVAPGSEPSSSGAPASGAPTPQQPGDDASETVAVAPSGVAAAEVEVPAEGDEVVVDEPFVFQSDSSSLHPGVVGWFQTVGFTPGAPVAARLTAMDGRDLSAWLRPVSGLVFGLDGDTVVSVLVPEGTPVPDLVELTVTDGTGLEASTVVLVQDFVVAPHLEAPVGATAGVVTVHGENGEAGQVAVVTVAGDWFFEGDPGEGGDGEVAPDEELVTTAADAAAEDDGELVLDDAPVAYDPQVGVATALVAVDDQGRFSASFVLPAGGYVADAAVVRRDGSASSDFSEPAGFTVAAAVVAPVAVVPAATAPVAVVPAVTTSRPAALAHTGSDSSAWLAVAAGLLVTGAAAVGGARLRTRRR